MKTNFVILAAGVGSRMGHLTRDEPKCMLKINGQTLIHRLIAQINEQDKIIVALGYKSEILREHISLKYPKVRFVINEVYSQTNNMYSFWLSTKLLDNKSALVTFNADCIYSDEFISEIKSSTSTSAFCHSDFYSEESMKLRFNQNNSLTGLSKSFEKDDFTRVCVDSYRFSQNDKSVFFNVVDNWIKNIDRTTWFEMALSRCIEENEDYMKFVEINADWYEIDTVEDYNSAKILFGEK